MPTIGFLHTADVHVETFQRLMSELAPEWTVRHLVDESLLADAQPAGVTAEIAERTRKRLAELESEGADLIVCTCSTIGGVAERETPGGPVERTSVNWGDHATEGDSEARGDHGVEGDSDGRDDPAAQGNSEARDDPAAEDNSDAEGDDPTRGDGDRIGNDYGSRIDKDCSNDKDFSSDKGLSNGVQRGNQSGDRKRGGESDAHDNGESDAHDRPTRGKRSVPVVRVDRPMAEAAVALGERIAVVATVASTLEPTMALLRDSAARAGKTVTITSGLCGAAWEFFVAGDFERYCEEIAAYVRGVAGGVDAVVLAQASMTPAAERLRGLPVLTSPRAAVEKAITMYGQQGPAPTS
ncbi:hypothetical protein ACTI_25680 [Actinoplanes sp. OR16]|uniref:hypothetical protein n=1 Tax=Actinoplanes sp. OR16 TaxID=946334 RepID=UPI000F6F5F60|nr:hypothetical protein [Actinoplanes sp. OR16]BBH65883.1 hypothetical protein ACTI_25680 [Actinoplanes sp. OR16]